MVAECECSTTARLGLNYGTHVACRHVRFTAQALKLRAQLIASISERLGHNVGGVIGNILS